jgi:hypothetical protein
MKGRDRRKGEREELVRQKEGIDRGVGERENKEKVWSE